MSSTHMRGNAVKRSVALIGAGAMVAGTFGFIAAPANAAPVRTDLSATCAGLSNSPFTDISGRTAEAQAAIGCLFNYDITQGRSSDGYAPADTVSRQEMAIFLSRQIDYVVDNSDIEGPSSVPASGYSDRNELTAEGRAAVDLLAELGITTGNADGTFDGERNITRAEMAVFIDRVQDVIADQVGEGARYNPEDADATFSDIDDDDFFADEVYSLQSVGIVQGTGDQEYSPNAPVIRADMAFFIMRHLDENIVAERVASLVNTQVGSFAVTPGGVVRTSVASPESAEDDQVYTVTGLTNGTTYRVTLVDADNIRTRDGVVEFKSSADPASLSGFSAAVGDQAAANIIATNGTTVAGTDVKTVTLTPVNGTATFTLDADALGTVVPVFYINGGPDSSASQGGRSIRLETDASAADEFAVPIESVGLGGAFTVGSVLAEVGIFFPTSVIAVDKASNEFEADTEEGQRRFTYDDNDRFFVNGGGTSLAAFEARLSSGDLVAGTFAADPAGESTFRLNDANPGTPAAPVVDEQGANRILTADFAAGTVDEVTVQRANVSVVIGAGETPETNDEGNDLVGAWTTLDTVDAVDSNAPTSPENIDFRYVDANVPVGTYRYRLIAINDGDPSENGAPTANQVVGTLDATAPSITDLRMDVNNANPLKLEEGDSFKLVASEPLAIASNATLRFTDGDGTVSDISRNFGNGFTLNTVAEEVNGVSYAAGRVLTVDVSFLQFGSEGTIEGIDLPATVTLQAGITDASANPLSLSGDVTLQQGGTATPQPEVDVAAPEFVSATATDGLGVLTLQYSETIDAFTVDSDGSDYSVTVDDAPLGAPVTAFVSDNVVSLTLSSGNFVAGQVVTVTKDADAVVADLAGNDQVDGESITFTVPGVA